MGLDAGKELTCQRESLLTARGAVIFSHTVDHEAYGIKLFLVIERRAVGIEAPVCPAILAVDKMVAYIVIGTSGHVEILRSVQFAIGGRKSPEYAGVENSPFGSRRVESIVAVASTVKPPAGSTIRSIQ